MLLIRFGICSFLFYCSYVYLLMRISNWLRSLTVSNTSAEYKGGLDLKRLWGIFKDRCIRKIKCNVTSSYVAVSGCFN